jgi:hypothetical protein
VANDGSLDLGDLSFSIDGDDLVAKLLPKIITQLIPLLATNAQLKTALVNAIMPEVTAQSATIARSTAGAGTTTPRTGPNRGR